jgi:hypothetical protein
VGAAVAYLASREASWMSGQVLPLNGGSNAAGGTKGCDETVRPLHIPRALKELNILWVRAGPAAFNEGNTKFIQFLCNADLIIGRKIKAF